MDLQLNPEISTWRKDPTADRALINDIKKRGQVQKIVARKLADGSLELVSGGRRYDGCLKAGVEPQVEVRENVSDVEAMLIAISENMHRKDLTPVEEARSFASLKKKKVRVKDIARHIGKSVDFVRGRLALLEVPESTLKKIEEGKLPLFVAKHISKLNEYPELQKEVTKDFAHNVRFGYNSNEDDLKRNVEKLLDKAQKRKELVAKHGPCPSCSSKRITETWTKGKLKCEECGHEYSAETKDPWKIVEMKREAKELGMDLSVVNGKGMVLNPKDVANHLAEMKREAKAASVHPDFRSNYPLNTWVLALLQKPDNLKKIEVNKDTITIKLIEETDLKFSAYRKQYKTGEPAKIHVAKPWMDDPNDTLAERKKAVLDFEKKVVSKVAS